LDIFMNKSSKGAIAAAAAGALLLGGAGSLAYWSDSVTIGGDTISAGKMSLVDTTGSTDDCADAAWLLDGGATFDPQTSALVPGDVLTKECTFDITAVGDHLAADLTTTGGAATGALAAKLTPSAAFTVAGASATSITDDNDGDELTATLQLTFPEGATSDNSSQELSLVLSDYTVALTQDHS
jgi:alternate signal-mediated exported protein